MNILYHYTKTRISKLTGLLLLVFALLANLDAGAQYCTPGGPINGFCCGGSEMGIQGFYMGTINHTPGPPSQAYTDFSSTLQTTVLPGQVVPFSFKLNINYQQYILIWVDWDGDEVFDNTPGSPEIVYETFYSNLNSHDGTITIPCGVSSGPKRMRVMADYYYYSPPNNCGSPYCDRREPCGDTYYGNFHDYTLNLAGLPTMDLGVENLITNNFVVGNNALKIKVRNNGQTVINNGTVGYRLSGSGNVVQSGHTFSPSLTVCNSGASQDVTFTTNLNIPTGGFYTLKVWATNPNGTGTDGAPANDTLTTNICTALGGTFTIDPNGSGTTNFTSFTAAINALKSCGIGSPVRFNVAAATYNEQITVTAINGSSATNTITFDGGAGNAASRILSFNTVSASDLHVVKVMGGSNLRFKNLTIKSTGTTYGFAVLIQSNSQNVHFKNNIITTQDVISGAISTNIQPLAISNSNNYYTGVSNVNNIEIDSNTVAGGYFTMSAYGANQNDVYEIKFRNNNVSFGYYYGIYGYYMNNIHINNNIIQLRNTTNTGGYAIQLSSIQSSGSYYNEISGNQLYNVNQIGIYLSSVNNPSIRGKMVNNTIGGGFKSTANYGLQSYSSSNWDIWHNSINMNGPTTTNTAAALYISSSNGTDIRNNMLADTYPGSLGILVWSSSAAQLTAFDYNNFYKTGQTSSTPFLNFNPNIYTMSNYKGALGFNTNSTSVFPLFTTPTNLRLNNLGLSPFGDASLGITKDIDGKSRCTLFPSIGASESPYVVSANAGIIADDTVFISSPVNIFNTAVAGEPKTHVWTIDSVGGSFSTINIKHTFATPGVYNVKLKTISCSGVDSAIKQIVVVSPTLPPVSAFLADVNNIDQGEPVQLSDLSTGGASAWLWSANPAAGVTFLPSANVQNPQVIFSNVGTFEICLRASNIAGPGNKICKPAYINVIEVNNLCGAKTVSKSVTGKLYDGGGKASDYANNTNCSFLLDPCAASVTLNFTSFSLGTGDVLRIYDGKDASGTPLHTSTGFAGLATPGSVTAKTGKMFIQLVADASGTSAGFEAKWVSTPKAFNKPSAAFKNSRHLIYRVPYLLSTATLPVLNLNWPGTLTTTV
jgi:PKD repeat protein